MAVERSPPEIALESLSAADGTPNPTGRHLGWPWTPVFGTERFGGGGGGEGQDGRYYWLLLLLQSQGSGASAERAARGPIGCLAAADPVPW